MLLLCDLVEPALMEIGLSVDPEGSGDDSAVLWSAEIRRIGWLCFWPKERRRKSACRGGRSVWPRVRATKGKMAGAKMGVGSVCLWQREGKWPAMGDDRTVLREGKTAGGEEESLSVGGCERRI